MNKTCILAGALIVIGIFVVCGCAMLPAPGNTIRPPKQVISSRQGDRDPRSSIVGFLPAGARLVSTTGAEAISEVDIEGDEKRYIMVTYKKGENPGEVGALLLKNEKGGLKKVWEERGFGYDLDYLGFTDITGDGKPEILIGGNIGISAGNGLSIFSWQDGTLKKIAGMGYHKIEVEDMPGRYGVDAKSEVALWQKDTGDFYSVEVVRWNDSGFVHAEDVYKYYFARVAEYYEQKVKDHPEAAIAWYYLADAQIKAENLEEALKSIEKGIALGEYYPPHVDFKLLMGKAYNKLALYQKAADIFGEMVCMNMRKTEDMTYMNRIMKDAYMGLGESFIGLKEYSKGRECFEQSLDSAKVLLKTGNDDPHNIILPAQKALLRLGAIENGEKIYDYISSIGQITPNRVERLIKWGMAHNITINAVIAEDMDGGLPKTLLVDYTSSDTDISGFWGHMIFWWQKGKLKYQSLYSADYCEHGLSQTCAMSAAHLSTGTSGTVEMAMIYDTAAGGSGSPKPIYRLLQLSNDKWGFLWSPPVSMWRNSHGKVTILGHGLLEIVIESDSWEYNDDKYNIFHESNVGPHRRFQDEWVRLKDTYVLKESRTLPSAYDTLVRFIYAISTGNDDEATKLVSNASLVDMAKQLKMIQNPIGQGWMISLDDTIVERTGPIKITSGPAEGVEVFFVQEEGRYIIKDITKK
jgi:tetratricopeptide (TPR) repeat protein